MSTITRDRRPFFLLAVLAFLATAFLPQASQGRAATITATPSTSCPPGTLVSLAWSPRASMSQPRAYFSSAALDSFIYAAGGVSTGGGDVPVNSVERFDPSTNSWSSIAAMPTARYHLGLTAANDNLYAIGGLAGNVPLAAVEEYKPSSGTWTTKASLPVALTHIGVGTLNGKVYVVGGSNAAIMAVSSVYEYDPVANTWASRASLSAPRMNMGIATLGGKLYAIGGRNDTSPLATVEVYDPGVNSWTTVASLSAPRVYGRAVAASGRVFMIGGANTAMESTVEQFDPSTGVWTAATNMLTARSGLGASESGGGTFAIGGTPNGTTALASVEEGTLTCAEAPTRALTVTKAGTGSGTVTSQPAGIDCGTDCSEDYALGTDVTLTAAAAPGSVFAGWSGACTGTGPCALTMDAAKSVTATFNLLNRAPVPQPGGPYSGNEGAAIQLSGSATDPDGDQLSYQWSYTKGPIIDAGAACSFDNPNALAPKLTCTDDGSYAVVLTVSDGVNPPVSSSAAAVTVANANPVPTITAPASGSIYPVGTAVAFSETFTDAGSNDTHTATWTIDTTSVSGTVTEVNGSGSGTATYTFTAPGVYGIKLTVNDDDGGSGMADTVLGLEAFVVIYDPNGGFVTGGGWVTSPVGACQLTPACQSLTGKATFGFVSKYKNGANAPTGETEFHFSAGGLNFHSSQYDWLVVAGAKAQFKGTGTINNGGNYGFMLTAVDGQLKGGGQPDTFRIKIWDLASGRVVYDNQMGAADSADPITTLGGGSVVIHK